LLTFRSRFGADPDWFVELFVDMYFISDIVFNFRTGVYDSDGVLIYARKYQIH
jgi:hypothetical protein